MPIERDTITIHTEVYFRIFTSALFRDIFWLEIFKSCPPSWMLGIRMIRHNHKIAISKSRYYKEGNVQSKKCQAIRRWFVSIRHGRHVLSQCPKEKHFPPVLVPFFNISGGWMPLFRALAKNMAPMTNADESPTNRLTLFPIYLSLFVVSTLWLYTEVNLLSISRSHDFCSLSYIFRHVSSACVNFTRHAKRSGILWQVSDHIFW